MTRMRREQGDKFIRIKQRRQMEARRQVYPKQAEMANEENEERTRRQVYPKQAETANGGKETSLSERSRDGKWFQWTRR
jgi:hypothetical protein